MSGPLQAYVLAIALGAAFVGFGVGIIFGVRYPRKMTAWRFGMFFAVIGLALIAFVIWGPGGPQKPDCPRTTTQRSTGTAAIENTGSDVSVGQNG